MAIQHRAFDPRATRKHQNLKLSLERLRNSIKMSLDHILMVGSPVVLTIFKKQINLIFTHHSKLTLMHIYTRQEVVYGDHGELGAAARRSLENSEKENGHACLV